MANVTAKMLSGSRVRTGKVRLSYCHLFQPFSSMDGAEPKYSVTLLIPKTDTQTKAALDEAFNNVYREHSGDILKGIDLKYLESPIRDGDGVTPRSKTPYPPEAHGHWVLSVKSKMAPKVVGPDLMPVECATDVYSGCYASVTVNAFAFNKSAKGITFGLGNVMKLEDGEPLGGGASAESDFGGCAVDPVTGEFR